MTSRFTNKGLQLLAQYEASPATKQPFSKLAIGTLTDAQAETADLYDGTETELHGEAVQIWDGVATTVDPNDPTGRTARVKATIIPNAEVKGETIREVGLYITDGGTDWLAWIGKFPATYIPAADEPDMATNLVVTIPIQFNSAASVAVSSNSANFATQDDMDELAGEFHDYSEHRLIPVYATCSAAVIPPGINQSALLTVSGSEGIFKAPEDGNTAFFHVITHRFSDPDGADFSERNELLNFFVAVYNSGGAYTCDHSSNNSGVSVSVENGSIRIYVPVGYHVIQAPMPVSVRGWVTRINFGF